MVISLAIIEPVLLFVHLLAMSVWVGGLVVLVVVTRVAQRELSEPTRVAFFRGLGRSYGVVGSIALTVALLSGAARLDTRDLDGRALAALVVALSLVLATTAGVVQAQGMTRLRREALDLHGPEAGKLSARINRNARRALILRALIGGLTLALLGLGVVISD